MDGRDIVCIMPTGMNYKIRRNLAKLSEGGGKSLTYQLPALLMTGCTLVISPLISLMTDQILHLREAGGNRQMISLRWLIYFVVPAAMITSATNETEKRKTLQRLQTLTEKTKNRTEKEIKLVYVTVRHLGGSRFDV